MRGNCALSLRGIWHVFNGGRLVMIPRPSEGRVARKAALLLWRWHHESESVRESIHSSSQTGISQAPRKCTTGFTKIHRSQRRYSDLRSLGRTYRSISIGNLTLLRVIAHRQTLPDANQSRYQRSISRRAGEAFTALFDPEFAEWQTNLLCTNCGAEMGVNAPKIGACQIVHGSLMSPAWVNAVRHIQGNQYKLQVSLSAESDRSENDKPCL